MTAIYAHDAVIVAGYIIEEVIRQYGRSIFTNLFKHHQLYNKGYPGLYCRPEDDKDHPNRPFEAFEFGEILFYALKKVIVISDFFLFFKNFTNLKICKNCFSRLDKNIKSINIIIECKICPEIQYL